MSKFYSLTNKNIPVRVVLIFTLWIFGGFSYTQADSLSNSSFVCGEVSLETWKMQYDTSTVDILTLTEQKNSLEKQIQESRSNMSTQNSKINNLENSIESAQIRIKTQQSIITENTNSIDSSRKKVQNMQSNIEQLKAEKQKCGVGGPRG